MVRSLVCGIDRTSDDSVLRDREAGCFKNLIGPSFGSQLTEIDGSDILEQGFDGSKQRWGLPLVGLCAVDATSRMDHSCGGLECRYRIRHESKASGKVCPVELTTAGIGQLLEHFGIVDRGTAHRDMCPQLRIVVYAKLCSANVLRLVVDASDEEPLGL